MLIARSTAQHRLCTIAAPDNIIHPETDRCGLSSRVYGILVLNVKLESALAD